MLKLLTRLVAVALLSAAPLIGSRTVEAQTRSDWPVYPSLYYSYQSCNVANNYVVCQPGGIMESQINSGYQCNEIDVVMTGYNDGPVDITMSADDQSLSQTMTIDGNGTYYTQFPGYLVNNLVALEFSMPDGASFGLPTIYSAPCPVATNTPTAAPTNTPNPSDTPTPTVNPSYTVTPIPTHTPLPSGHSTFTPTTTMTPGPTATATPTAAPSLRNCGDATFPLLNCDWIGGTFANQTNSTPPTDWSTWNGGGYVSDCGPDQPFGNYNNSGSYFTSCDQKVTPTLSGDVYIEYQADAPVGNTGFRATLAGYQSGGPGFSSACTVGSGCDSYMDVGSVTAGVQADLFVGKALGGSGQYYQSIYLVRAWVGSSANTPTPGPTDTATATAVGPTATVTATPLPNPFASDTPGPTDTPCPSGCAVAQLTSVPGISTMITVDTSPLSALDHLSLSRSSCTPFGYVQIPYPVITGTPALGQPLNFGWTVPVTHTWDNTNPITNTAIQPCAMNSIPSYLWDTTYWGSVLAIAVVFFIWLIGFVGRLSGDHTING